MAGDRSTRKLCVLALMAGAPAYASNLTITPIFDTTITSDANANAIEGTINSAISIYETDFSNPIDVTIDFKETTSGLGSSSTRVADISYSNFYNAYKNNAIANNNFVALTALAGAVPVVPAGPDNPVTGDTGIWVKTANIKALGLTCPGGCPAVDGTISLNTAITSPGSPSSSLAYFLMPVVEHEMNEVLGLGSFLGTGLRTTDPLPEDLFRFDQLGNRTFTTSSGALAFFSITGKTDLAQFDNQNDGGDFADWQSNPRPSGVQPKVQDAFATPGANPQLGVELIALEAVGFDETTPEPASVSLFIVSAPLFWLFARRRTRTRSLLSQLDERPAGK